MSDHCLITFSLDVTLITHNGLENRNNEEKEYINFSFSWRDNKRESYINSINTDQFTQFISQLDVSIDQASNTNEIETCLSSFVEGIEKVCIPLFSRKTNYNSDPPMSNGDSVLDETTKDKRRTFYKSLNVYRKNKSEANKASMIQARSDYKRNVRINNYKNMNNKTTKLMSAKYKNAKEYWKLLKEGTTHKSPKNISLDSFTNYFKAINDPQDRFFQPDEDILYFNNNILQNELKTMFSELDLPFSEDDVLKGISNLNLGKSAGPDRILNEFLIYGKHKFSTTLVKLFNKLLVLEYFPEKWTEGYIVPIHKKGSLTEVGNFRGITLLSVIGKLFTNILNTRLSNWAEYYQIYIEAQAGFRAKMSTIDNIYVLQNLINHVLNDNKQLFCAFIDFTKAFDYIVRDNLWYKLYRLGIRGHVLAVIKSMYNHVYSRVKHENSLGTMFESYLGVRQGECLSPLLFSLFINDLEEELYIKGAKGIDTGLLKFFLLLYADDIVIFANSAEEMQDNLNILEEYCNKWKLKVNKDKTKVIVFRKGGRLPMNLQFLYQGHPLEIVSTFTYLGVVFSSGGSLMQATKTLSGQAHKAIFKLRKHLNKFVQITPQHKI